MSQIGVLFRVVWYKTKDSNKFHADDRHEYLTDREGAFTLWYYLNKELGYPHVEVYSLDGVKQEPTKGINGLSGYSV